MTRILIVEDDVRTANLLRLYLQQAGYEVLLAYDGMAALDLALRSPSPTIKIEFQGGEPLLNFPLIRQVVCEAKRRNPGKELAFVIATNLALISPEILEFCQEHQILISTSLDGPKDLHNANRPRPGGDSYEKAIEGIRLARNSLGGDKVSALMTTTERSLNKVKEIVDEYLAQGFDGIFLRPLSPYGFAIKTKSYAKYNLRNHRDVVQLLTDLTKTAKT